MDFEFIKQSNKRENFLLNQSRDEMSDKVVMNLITRRYSASTMVKNSLEDIVQKLNGFASIKTAENWDNVGLLIEPATPKPIQKIILTNDLTESVLNEAVEKKSDLIISYHPPIFTGLKTITQKSWKMRLVSVCLENRIALYSPHTSWDNTRGAIADWLLRALPHKESQIILPSAENCNIGSGRMAQVESSVPITLAESIECVKKHTGIKTVQVAIGVNKSMQSTVNSFAVCPGSGSSVLKGVPVDLYISGEMSHHDVLEAMHNNVSVILCNHSNSERGFLTEFKGILANLLDDSSVEIQVSQNDIDPLVTY